MEISPKGVLSPPVDTDKWSSVLRLIKQYFQIVVTIVFGAVIYQQHLENKVLHRNYEETLRQIREEEKVKYEKQIDYFEKKSENDKEIIKQILDKMAK